MVDMVLFPSSFSNITKVDEDLQKEYEAVVATGVFDVVLFGYDKWFNEDKYRGNLLTGGICIKEFLDLKRYGEKTNEYRVFYICDRCF